MSKYIMRNGLFLDNETQETTSSITGVLVGIRQVKPDDDRVKLEIDLRTTTDEGETVTNTLRLQCYKEPALKILRSLYQVYEIIAEKVITISMEAREGRSSLMRVSADGELLPPSTLGEAFAYEERAFIDRAVALLRKSLEFKQTVLVYSNADKQYSDGFDTEAICQYIRELRRSGRTGELRLEKTTFTNASAARGYLKALHDLAPTRSFRCTDNAEAIAAVMAAFTEDLPEESAEPEAATSVEAISDEMEG